MKTSTILSMLLIAFIVWSCKQEATQQEDSAPVSEQGTEQTSPAATGGHDYTYLTNKLFHVKGAFVSGQKPGETPYDKHWFDLRTDGTYAYGIGSKHTYSGKWAYNHDAQVLAMTPDDKANKSSEWKVMHNEQMVVLIGTRTYGDNGTQLQLVWRDELPAD